MSIRRWLMFAVLVFLSRAIHPDYPKEDAWKVALAAMLAALAGLLIGAAWPKSDAKPERDRA